MKKALSMLAAAAAVAMVASSADAACVSNNVQNKDSNSGSSKQNCKTNFSTNFQIGTGDNKFKNDQTGANNFFGSAQSSRNGTNQVINKQRDIPRGRH